MVGAAQQNKASARGSGAEEGSRHGGRVEGVSAVRDAFLVHEDSGRIVEMTQEQAGQAENGTTQALRAPKVRRVLADKATTWSYDSARQLLWYAQKEQLFVLDLTADEGAASRPVLLADPVPEAPRIVVHWVSKEGQHSFVSRPSACEPLRQLTLTVQAEPTLYWMEDDSTRELTAEGKQWLSAARQRVARPVAAYAGFSDSEGRVALPEGWAGCEEEQRCGSFDAVGSQRLVLVEDALGADCWHRSCVWMDPQAGKFKSPPVLRDEETAELSLAPAERGWGTLAETEPGLCGPYQLDAEGSRLLVSRFLCQLDGGCQELQGEAIGWREPGAIVGEPG